jgi:hypothetical protein
MIKRILAIVLSLVFVLTATGCSNRLHKAVPINIANIGYEVYRVAIAVDYFGVKHIARTECPIGTSTNCKLIYSRAYSGGATDIWSWSSTTDYTGVFEIDLAVTDSGTAALTWNSTKTAGSVKTTLFMLTSDPWTVQELMPGYVVYDSPLLVSRYNVIYAINQVYNGSYLALRYRQMIGGSASGWVSELGISEASVFANAAVSPSGWLYVTYRHTPSFDLCYADNYGTTGDMTNSFVLLGGVPSYREAAIDVYGSPEIVYLAYFNHTGTTNDNLYLGHCPAIACTIPTFVSEYPLDVSKHWDIDGELSIVADAGVNAYFVFRAKNDDTVGDYEIFEGYTQSGIPQGVVNISSLAGSDAYPAIGLNAGYIAVTTWVHGNNAIYEFETLPTYFYFYQRKIQTTSNPIITWSSGRDMSCNADWGAGIWIEDEAANRAYFIFNTLPSFLPIIIKPAGGSI